MSVVVQAELARGRLFRNPNELVPCVYVSHLNPNVCDNPAQFATWGMRCAHRHVVHLPLPDPGACCAFTMDNALEQPDNIIVLMYVHRERLGG